MSSMKRPFYVWRRHWPEMPELDQWCGVSRYNPNVLCSMGESYEIILVTRKWSEAQAAVRKHQRKDPL